MRHDCGAPCGRPCALLWACFAWAMLAATEPLPAAPSTRFSRLSVEDGLSQNTVQAILQDRAGYLWFATEEGLNRWDGYAFLVFKHDPKDSASLPDNLVSALHEDAEGRLWVGTATGVSWFDPRTESFTRALSTRGRITALFEEPDGTLWAGTEGAGLHERAPGRSSFVAHRNDPADPRSLGGDVVSALLRDRRGRLWVGTWSGLDRREPDGGFRHFRFDADDPASLSHDQVWGLAEDPAGAGLWVATNGGGLNLMDPETGRVRRFRHRQGDPLGIPTDLLTSLLVDRAGTLWIGSEGRGLFRRDPATGRFETFLHDVSDPASLSQNIVRTLYEDRQGQIWIGTFTGGASILRQRRHAFHYFTHDPKDPGSLSDPSVASFVEDGKGFVWIGTEGGGLNRFDRATGRFLRVVFPSSIPGRPAILALHEDSQGRLWAGTYRRGLARFDPAGRTFTHYEPVPGDPRSLGNSEVWVIGDGGDGTLWLGTNVGLEHFDPATGQVTARHTAADPPGPGHLGIRALLHDSKGNLWAGTLSGLGVLAPGAEGLVLYRHDEKDPLSLSHDWVVALHEDRRGRLWLGTYGGGLNRFDPATGTFEAYKEAQGAPSDVVYGILEDPRGRLWLSTNHGLSRFDPDEERFESFDTTNGLESLQFHQGASLKTRDGRLLFGSVNGFYDFDPEAIRLDSYAPPVVLTSLRLYNRPVKLPEALSGLKEITLSHEDKVFALEFAALDYTVPRRNRYAYILEGLSEQWIDLGDQRSVTFTNLDPGSYLFRVRASNSDGVWSEEATSLRIHITPPFWQTWWFRLLAVASAIVGLSALHRFRVRQLEERERELTLRVEEALGRVRILKGLIPMCAWCKKIRDDRGYWSQVETYIRERSEADFSHGICPDCSAQLYPGGPPGVG